MATLQNMLNPQLDLLAERGRKQRLAVARKAAVSAALPLAVYSLPLLPFLVLVFSVTGLVQSLLPVWLITACTILFAVVVFAIRYLFLMRGKRFSRRACLALFDDAVASGERINTADEFLARPTLKGFQLAAVSDAEPAIVRALEVTFPPSRHNGTPAGIAQVMSVLAACLLLGILCIQPVPSATTKTTKGSVIADMASVAPPGSSIRTAENTDKNDRVKASEYAPLSAGSPTKAATVPLSSTPVTTPNTASSASPGSDLAAKSSAEKSQSTAAGSKSESKPGNAKQSAGTQLIPHRANPEQAPEKRGESSAAEALQGAGESAASPTPQDEQNAQANNQPRDNSATGNPAAESEANKAAATQVAAAVKGGKPPAEARKGQQQQQQEQGGNKSNRNSQNSGNQAGDDGQKQSRGIGGLMLSVPMADQFTGTQGPGPKQQKIRPDLLPEQLTEAVPGEYRGNASGDAGSRHHLFNDTRDRQLLQSLYQRNKQPQSDTSSQSDNNNHQQGQ